MKIEIKLDNIEDQKVVSLLKHHIDKMYEDTPAESVHVLGVEALKKPDISFWTLWIDEQLAGCGALKAVNDSEGEIKSMRTHGDFLRRGVSGKILTHIIEEGKKRGYKALYLETGADEYFFPAHALYRKHGFKSCEPFGNYKDDVNSLYMVKWLR